MEEIEIKPKQIWNDHLRGETVRVMGIVEGYVVARYKGCMPFLRHRKDFVKDFKPIEGD